MQNQRFLPLIILLFLIILPTTCFAFEPDVSLDCNVDYKNIPEHTVYIDLLLPVSPDDEVYTQYNSANGEQFGISQDSQIVQYDTDGYRSYTFHFKDASSEIRPRYFVYILCDATLYDENSAIFEKAELTPTSSRDSRNRYSLDKTIYLGSDEDLAMEAVCEILDISIIYERNKTKVSFHTDNNLTYTENNYEKFSDFCRKYKTAKIAYLDKDGNILRTTNATSIYKTDLLGRAPAVILRLSGNELTSDIIYGPPVFLVALIFLLIILVILITVIVRLIAFIVNYAKLKKSTKL